MHYGSDDPVSHSHISHVSNSNASVGFAVIHLCGQLNQKALGQTEHTSQQQQRKNQGLEQEHDHQVDHSLGPQFGTVLDMVKTFLDVDIGRHLLETIQQPPVLRNIAEG